MAFSRVLQPQSEKIPNSSIVTVVLIRIFRIVDVSPNVVDVLSPYSNPRGQHYRRLFPFRLLRQDRHF
jgi:hypothetical protein